MRQSLQKAFLLVALATAHGLMPSAVAQSSGGPYVIDRVAIAGGGSPLGGGAYRLSGTLGQSATATLAASPFTMFDGFWTPVSLSTSDRIFANGFDPGF
jgi:hypothetical protein